MSANTVSNSPQTHKPRPLTDDGKKMEEKMKKIAVAYDNGMVAGHFGHCEAFAIFDTEGSSIVWVEEVVNPGHKPGFLPSFLSDKGAAVIIAGGMGEGAVNKFKEKGIEIVVGASGDAREAVQAYLDGRLQSDESVCHRHEHHSDSCTCGH